MAENFAESKNGGCARIEPSTTDFLLRRSKRGGLIHQVAPTVPGLDGLLPDAQNHRVGFPFMVVFAINNGFDIYDNSKSNLICTLAAGEVAHIALVDNSSQDGIWSCQVKTVPVFIPFLTGTEWTAVVREISGEQTWINYPTTIFIDTATKVATGGMESDGSDIEFRLEDDTILDFEIVAGMNTASTEFVVVIPELVRHEWELVYMYSGDLIIGSGGPTITGPHSQPATHQPEIDVADYDKAINPRVGGGLSGAGRYLLDRGFSSALSTPIGAQGTFPATVLGSAVPVPTPAFTSDLQTPEVSP